MEAHSCFTPLESPAISCGRNESRGKECGWGPACMMHAAAVFSPGWLPWLSIFMPSALQGLPAGHHSRRLQPTLVCGSTAGTAAVAMSGVPAQAGPLLQVDAGAVADNEAGTSQWACHRLPATRHAHTHTPLRALPICSAAGQRPWRLQQPGPSRLQRGLWAWLPPWLRTGFE